MTATLIVSACDTGSANALAPVLSRLSCHYHLIAQQAAARVFDRWGIPYQPMDPIVDWEYLLDTGRQVLAKVDAKALVAGTSWGPSLDKALTLAAREEGIPCAALVEHWDLYMERFSLTENGHIRQAACFLPDRVWVNDTTARAEAMTAGVPVETIDVVGQPHLEMQLQALRRVNVEQPGRGIVFISERVRDDFVQGSPLYRGFDEFEVLGKLLDVIDLANTPLLVKLHPQEEERKFDDLIDGRENVRVVKKADNVELIAKAGRVVGMFSMLLLEAALVRDDVISFMPGGDASVFVGNRLGATRPATTDGELKRLLADHGAVVAGGSLGVTPFGKQFVGSAARMAEAIEGMMQ